MAAKHEVFDAGGWQEVARCEVLDTGGVWRQIKRREVLDTDGTTWRTVAIYAPPITAAVTPDVASGSVSLGFAASVDTGSVTATPTGGAAPYTYSWANAVNGGGSAAVAASPSFATTSFIKPGVNPGETIQDTMRVTITSSLGGSATADVICTFTNFGGGGGIDP